MTRRSALCMLLELILGMQTYIKYTSCIVVAMRSKFTLKNTSFNIYCMATHEQYSSISAEVYVMHEMHFMYVIVMYRFSFGTMLLTNFELREVHFMHMIHISQEELSFQEYHALHEVHFVLRAKNNRRCKFESC